MLLKDKSPFKVAWIVYKENMTSMIMENKWNKKRKSFKGKSKCWNRYAEDWFYNIQREMLFWTTDHISDLCFNLKSSSNYGVIY